MDSSRSLILTYIQRVRDHLDEGGVDAKYTDAKIVQQHLGSSIQNVLARLNMDAEDAVHVEIDIDLVSGQEYYRLPVTNGQIVGLYKRAATQGNGITSEIIPQHDEYPGGPGWAIEGNELRIRPVPGRDETWRLRFKPSGVAMPHYATDGSSNAGGDQITLSNAPAKGLLDYKVGAYVGQVVRVIDLANRVVEEAVISDHTESSGTHTITLRRPLSNANLKGASGDLTYEIVPLFMQPMVDALVYETCLRIASSREKSGSFIQNTMLQYRIAIKTIKDLHANRQTRTSKAYRKVVRGREVNAADGGPGAMGIIFS